MFHEFYCGTRGLKQNQIGGKPINPICDSTSPIENMKVKQLVKSVKNKDGRLITVEPEVLKRWSEYFLKILAIEETNQTTAAQIGEYYMTEINEEQTRN